MKSLYMPLAALILAASPAFGAIGATQCSSADGSLKRTEQEVWGANIVKWFYNDAEIDAKNVKLDTEGARRIDTTIRTTEEMGEERTETAALKVQVKIDDQTTVSDFMLCKSITYPNVVD